MTRGTDMKVTRRLGKYEVDFTNDLVLTKSTKTEMQGRDLRDFKLSNITRVPINTFLNKIKASFITLAFIWFS